MKKKIIITLFMVILISTSVLAVYWGNEKEFKKNKIQKILQPYLDNRCKHLFGNQTDPCYGGWTWSWIDRKCLKTCLI